MAVLMSTHSLFFEQKYEKYQHFYQKFSIYLNRRVFIIECILVNIMIKGSKGRVRWLAYTMYYVVLCIVAVCILSACFQRDLRDDWIPVQLDLLYR